MWAMFLSSSTFAFREIIKKNDLGVTLHTEQFVSIVQFYRLHCLFLDEIVALKKLKMEKEKEGFPITSLREINTLLKAQHVNIVTVREIVVGSNMDKIFIVMDYVEHDLKSLMESMKEPFIIGEDKFEL